MADHSDIPLAGKHEQIYSSVRDDGHSPKPLNFSDVIPFCGSPKGFDKAPSERTHSDGSDNKQGTGDTNQKGITHSDSTGQPLTNSQPKERHDGGATYNRQASVDAYPKEIRPSDAAGQGSLKTPYLPDLKIDNEPGGKELVKREGPIKN